VTTLQGGHPEHRSGPWPFSIGSPLLLSSSRPLTVSAAYSFGGPLFDPGSGPGDGSGILVEWTHG